jgi:hypothetical protein
MSRKQARKRARPGIASVAPASTAANLATIAQPPTPAAPLVSVVSDEIAASDEIAVQFFSAPPVTHPDEPVAVEVVDAIGPSGDRPARLRAASAAAAARRRDLTRYVTGAVAVCFMICVAAAVRAATVHAGPNPPALSYQTSSGTGAPRVEEPAQQPAPPAEALPSPAPQAEPPAAAPEARAEAVVPEQQQTAPEPAATAPDTSPADPAAALAARHDAQRAIDRGDMAHAIEASQRSIDLDRTDAEAWLILGAAYLQKGAYREAREAFTTCTHEATRGPRGECRALLR